MKTLKPITDGLDHQWKTGEVGLFQVWYRLCFGMVIEANGPRLVCLTDDCSVRYCAAGDLVTLEGYKKHIEYMRNDITGKEYSEAMERARGASFVTPRNWEEAEARARGDLDTLELYREERRLVDEAVEKLAAVGKLK